MRHIVVVLQSLGLLLLSCGNAFACRGPFLSVSEIAHRSASIFTATVVAHISPEAGGDLFDLRVTEVLKGSVVGTVHVKGYLLIQPNEGCLAFESGIPSPHVVVGEKWIVSGKVNSTGEVEPISGGSFRLVQADGKSIEGASHLLKDIRHAILMSSDQSSGPK